MQKMSEKTIEEMKEDFMKFPTAVADQLGRHTDLIGQLLKTQDMFLELVCKLHDIDFEELKAEFHSSENNRTPASKVKTYE